MAKDELEQFVKDNEVSLTSKFVPWSVSRNRNEKAFTPYHHSLNRSLNWHVTLLVRGKPIVEFDYSAGMAHCPAYMQFPPKNMHDNTNYMARIEHETEIGTVYPSRTKKIEPDILDVLYSLAMDADVLNYSTFEEWASSLGFDPDSRKVEAMHRECLRIALAMKNSGLDLGKLQEAAEGY